MIRFGKTAQHAVMCLSCLAETQRAPDPTLNSFEIARRRQLPHPTVAKSLCALSRARLVYSAPGPGGGYLLARPPSEINLLQVITLFEDHRSLPCCADRHDHAPHCNSPLHAPLRILSDSLTQFLANTTLATLLHAKATTQSPPGESACSHHACDSG